MPQSEDSRDRLEKRDWDMWKLYVKGTTQRQIATRFEVSQATVSERLAKVRESIPPESKQQVVQRHLDTLASMTNELWKLVDAGPVPAYSNGRRMTMPSEDAPDDPNAVGEQVWDHSGRLAAMDRLTKMLEREAKLLGIDSAEKVEMNATVEHRPQEVLDLLARERQRVEAEEAALREGRQREESEAREEYGPA